jgi:hypothetical protein
MPMTSSGPLGGPGDPCDRDGRGVRGQDDARFADLVEFPEDVELEVFPLDSRLDDEIGVFHVFQVGTLPDTAQDFLLLVRRQFFLCHQSVEVFGNGVKTPVDELVRDVVHDDVESARVRRYLSDAVTHLAGSHYAERFYCHSLSLLT